MAIVQMVWILSPILCICTLVSGDIFTSEFAQDKWINLNSETGHMIKRSLSRFRRSPPTNKPQPTVTEFELQNGTTHNQALIHWSGNDSKVIFILTRKKSSPGYNQVTESTLWRSSDYGVSYQCMTSAFSKTTILKSYFISPTNTSKVILVDAHNRSRILWLSYDEGLTYKFVKVPFSVEKIDFHPLYSDWLLGYDKIRRELYCSKDFGVHWKKLGDEVTSDRYYWYVKNVDKGSNAEEIVFFEYRHIQTSFIQRIFKVKSCYIPDCRPTEFQKKLDTLENIDQDSLVVQNSFIFVQKSGAANKLYVSYERGEFSRAMFPRYQSLAQAHFHIVSSDGGCVVIGINHDNGLTHLFFSDKEGKKYTQSLSNMRYFNKKTTDNKVFSVDIYKVQGIIGTFIANVLTPGENQNTTKITWNNGRSWSDITSNVFDMDKKDKAKSLCNKCSLNLHLTMEQTPYGYYMQSVLAKASYPGLIIAHGTYGRTIEDRPEHVNVYLSRDNGHSWHAVAKKRHFIVVTNHGAVIVMMRMIFGSPIKSFSFSSNYGRDFVDHDFVSGGRTINVDGILTEPGERKPHITLFGHHTYTGSWKVYQIDVSPLFPKVCNFPDDFENVTIPSGTSAPCHLGVRQSYERLTNHGQNCLISANYSRIVTVKNCDCSLLYDYECDLGYKMVTKNGRTSCARERQGPVDHVSADMHEAYENALLDEKAKCVGDKRNVSTGFRKVPGNRCVNEMANIYWKLEDCVEGSTTAPAPLVHIKRKNDSNIMKMGDVVVFSVQGGDSKTIVWRVESDSWEKKLPQTKDKFNFNFGPKEPGRYNLRAEIAGTSVSSQWETVQFWYPIEKIHLFHPPVVTPKNSYNVTAWTWTKYGLRGYPTLVGEVGYTWDVEPSGSSSKSRMSKKNSYQGKPPSDKVSAVKITVTADNTVSQRSTTGRILVSEYFVQLVMEMECTPPIAVVNMTDVWLDEFQAIVAEELLQMEAVQDVKKKYSLTNKISMYIYVAPSYPLKVHLYLAPTKEEHSKDKLLEAAEQLEAIVAEPPFSVNLYLWKATMSKLYIVDYDGTIRTYEPYSGGNAATIIVVIIVVLLILVVGILAFRHYSRRFRFDRYLHFRNLRPENSRSSRIVRNQDRSPIVEEEFIDDDLNAMEDIGGRDAQLQFQG